jgi:inner membrane protein
MRLRRDDADVASLAHVAVGIAGGRFASPRAQCPLRLMIAFGVLSMLADADVIAFRLGIPYSAPFGHRGATHSVMFALLAGCVFAALLSRGKEGRFWPLALVATVVAVSHPLLDALTDGGLGVALLWPFSNDRFFATWRPIPVAPIGGRMLSSRGLHVLLIETLWSSPLLVWSFWPRNTKRARA